MLQLLKNIKLVPVLITIIILLSALSTWQHSRLSTFKDKLAVCKGDLSESNSQVKQNASVVESLVIGSTETVKQLQASNDNYKQIIKDQETRNNNHLRQKKQNEITIGTLKERVTSIKDVCTNTVIPVWLLADTD